MSSSPRRRLNNFRKELREGRVPRLHMPIPGITYEVLCMTVREHGLEPGVDIYIPAVGSPEEQLFRRRWKERRYFLRHSPNHIDTWRDEIRTFYLSGVNDSAQAQYERMVAVSQIGTPEPDNEPVKYKGIPIVWSIEGEEDG